ncbi:MAG: hypothetical protein LN589_02365 [Rickettsia endosymbiont of Eriopis connexa]|nr:hypothetical protein [Rickettsia endosymbiont of Eriopis connexa]
MSKNILDFFKHKNENGPTDIDEAIAIAVIEDDLSLDGILEKVDRHCEERSDVAIQKK